MGEIGCFLSHYNTWKKVKRGVLLIQGENIYTQF